jgi:hypothetical protein
VFLGIFLGGKSSTRIIARLFLVDVSEFLQSFFYFEWLWYIYFAFHSKIMKLLV